MNLYPGTTIALDFRWLDHLNLGNGQYRYCVALIGALAQLSVESRFLVIGSGRTPPEAIRPVFSNHDRWRYRQLPIWKIKGNYYLDHLRYRWLLREERVDLIHSLHTFLPLLSHTRQLVTIYDMMLELFPEYRAAVVSRPYRVFKHAVQSGFPWIIAISQTTADDLHRLWGVPQSNIAVVPLSVHAAEPHCGPGTEEVVGLGAPFVLAPFNLEPRKNLISLLRAIAEVRRGRSDIRLVLYGHAAVTATRERQFQSDVRQLGLQGAVVLTGLLSDGELSFLYRRAALFVFPSLYEGFGLPVLEAMAAGVCTITRSRSAMAEVLGDAGVQIETTDPTLLARTIQTLLDDPHRCAHLGEAARQRSAQFTMEVMAQRTFAAYIKALERPDA